MKKELTAEERNIIKRWFEYYENKINEAPEGREDAYIDMQKAFFEGMLYGVTFGSGKELHDELEEYLEELEAEV